MVGEDGSEQKWFMAIVHEKEKDFRTTMNKREFKVSLKTVSNAGNFGS